MKKILIATRNKDKFATIKQVLSKMAKEEYNYYSLYDIEGLDKDKKKVEQSTKERMTKQTKYIKQ